LDDKPLVTTTEKMDENVRKRPTVAVIGCGPAGMFFLHALAERKRTLEEAGDAEGLSRLPSAVTCYERSSSAGGVWKAERCHEDKEDRTENESVSTVSSIIDGYGDENRPEGNVERIAAFEGFSSTDAAHARKSAGTMNSASSTSSTSSTSHTSGNMYEALWTNGPKERIEFFDYSYDDHFGKGVGLPSYFPRQHLLEYMIARCTRRNPTFFDNVRFNRSVTSVTYDDDQAKFTIKSCDNDSGAVETATYDKCIWAAGDNGKSWFPSELDKMLKEDGFLGLTIHSSEVGAINFDQAVRGRSIVMIGDSFSAEDLTLQAIKCGAEKVYVVSRHGDGITNFISRWPGDRVEILDHMKPTQVIREGRGIRFEETEMDYDVWKMRPVDGGKVVELEDVALVVYCTGYSSNRTMLDASLQQPFLESEVYCMPEDWRMAPNTVTEDLGHVKPNDEIEPSNGTVVIGIYRTLLMSNPNMMFISQFSSAPLFEIDVYAWICLGYITGDIETPSEEEMAKRNAEQIHAEMDVPNLRYMLDGSYYQRLNEFCSENADHWLNIYDDPKNMEQDYAEEEFHLRCIARDMCDGGYPDNIGTFSKLNQKGRELLHICTASWRHRVGLSKQGPNTEWTTFRDGDTSELASVHTGTKAAPLRKPWLELSGDEYDDLLRSEIQAPTVELSDEKNRKSIFSVGVCCGGLDVSLNA